MKKLWLLIVAVLVMGCSGAGEGEVLGEVQEELACAYPIGLIGSTNPPSSGKVTKFLATGPKTVAANYVTSSGWGYTRNFNWDPAGTASMSGGWVGTLLTKASFPVINGVPAMTLNPGLPDEATIIFANGGEGVPVGTSFEMNEGVTKIQMVTTGTGNYRAIEFTGYHNGVQVVKTRTIPTSGGC